MYKNIPMYKKFFTLSLLVLFACGCQNVKAFNAKRKSTPPPPQKEKAVNLSEAAKTNKPNLSDAVKTSSPKFKVSPYKPSGLLYNLNFESEEIQSLKNQKNKYDKLVIKTAEGKRTSIGIMYEGGTESDRYAKVIADPTKSGNHVFHYWMKNSRVPDGKKGKYKGRIQMNLTKLDKTSLFQRYRLYLHPDIDLYRQYPEKNVWFGISTMWMGAKWQGHPYPFKISLNIGKPPGAGKPLYFVVGASTADGGKAKHGRWKDVWAKVAPNYEIPVGEWLDIEIGYRAGNKTTGRFYMAVKSDKDKEFTTVFDVTDWTYHPDSPKPVPVTDWQPLKLYASSKVTDFIRNKGGVAQMYWDDLEIYENW